LTPNIVAEQRDDWIVIAQLKTLGIQSANKSGSPYASLAERVLHVGEVDAR